MLCPLLSRLCRCPTSTAGTATTPSGSECRRAGFSLRSARMGHRGRTNGVRVSLVASNPRTTHDQRAAARRSECRVPRRDTVWLWHDRLQPERPHMAIARMLAGHRERGGPLADVCDASGDRPLVAPGARSFRRGTDVNRHRRCPGRWRAEVCLGYGPGGKRRPRRVSGSTKAAVQDALKSLRADAAAGITKAAPVTTPCAKQPRTGWRTGCAAGQLRPSA
jgi:hypothetical protein